MQGGEVKRRARVHTSGLTSEIPRQMHPNHGSEYLPWLHGAIAAAAAAAAVAEVHASAFLLHTKAVLMLGDIICGTRQEHGHRSRRRMTPFSPVLLREISSESSANKTVQACKALVCDDDAPSEGLSSSPSRGMYFKKTPDFSSNYGIVGVGQWNPPSVCVADDGKVCC